MTRDLLRTVINKQKVKPNIGIQMNSKAVLHRTASTNNTIKPELVFDRRRPVSQSTRYGQAGHRYQNTRSANTTTTSGFARSSQPAQTSTPWKDLKLGSTSTGLPISVQSSMKPSRTNAYPFSLLETIFTENSLKPPAQAPTAPVIQAPEPRADSAFPSMRSLATSGGRGTETATATNGLRPQHSEPYQHIVQASAGRPSLKESVYRRTHRSGGYRTEPNDFL